MATHANKPTGKARTPAQTLASGMAHWADNPGAGGILSAAGVSYSRTLDLVIVAALVYLVWHLHRSGDI